MEIPFEEFQTPKKRSLGKTTIDYKRATSILTKTSGFMKDYDFSLNPYSGCSFGCNYCYAAFFVRNREKQDNWGKWIEIKENAITLLKKRRSSRGSLNHKTVYLSSVTDPYQPIEKELEITRSILTELIEFHPEVRLVIQTRSPLVKRDIDILKLFQYIQINMTITTDSEEIRKVFEPFCPSNQKRLETIQKLHDCGIPSCITMTPLLPIQNPEKFAISLKKTGINKFIIQPFHKEKGRFVAGTRKEAQKVFEKYNWGNDEYKRVLKIMQSILPNLGEGKSGFAPI